MITHEIATIGALWIAAFAFWFGTYLSRKFASIEHSLTAIENERLREANHHLYESLLLAEKQACECKARLDAVLTSQTNLRSWN
jgi:hypothetical protein